MNCESLQHIFHSTEIDVIEHQMNERFEQSFNVVCFNPGDNNDFDVKVSKEDFENWYTGYYGIDVPRDLFFSTYYEDTATFQDDMLTYMLDTKRDCEAFSQESEMHNWDSIFNSISRITQPEIAA